MTTYLTIDSGDTERLTIAVTDPDGDPVDLLGATLLFLAKAAATDADEDAVITKATGGEGITISSPSSGGLAEVAIAPADTASLEGKFVWGLQGTDSGGNVTTLASGLLTIRADIVEG